MLCCSCSCPGCCRRRSADVLVYRKLKGKQCLPKVTNRAQRLLQPCKLFSPDSCPDVRRGDGKFAVCGRNLLTRDLNGITRLWVPVSRRSGVEYRRVHTFSVRRWSCGWCARCGGLMVARRALLFFRFTAVEERGRRQQFVCRVEADARVDGPLSRMCGNGSVGSWWTMHGSGVRCGAWSWVQRGELLVRESNLGRNEPAEQKSWSSFGRQPRCSTSCSQSGCR